MPSCCTAIVSEFWNNEKKKQIHISSHVFLWCIACARGQCRHRSELIKSLSAKIIIYAKSCKSHLNMCVEANKLLSFFLAFYTIHSTTRSNIRREISFLLQSFGFFFFSFFSPLVLFFPFHSMRESNWVIFNRECRVSCARREFTLYTSLRTWIGSGKRKNADILSDSWYKSDSKR